MLARISHQVTGLLVKDLILHCICRRRGIQTVFPTEGNSMENQRLSEKSSIGEKCGLAKQMITLFQSFKNLERCSGFAMIEVLVTLIVLTVGILGFLGLQTQGLKNNHSAYIKSQVVSVIDDMADRMRANKAGLNANLYANIDTSTLSADPGFDCMTNYTETSIANECSSQELATYDIYAWGKTLGSLLFSGQGTVTCNDSPCISGSTHTITVSWDDYGTGNADVSFSVIVAL